MKTGWLSPTGEFFPCASYCHFETALSIAAKTGLLKNAHHADDALLDAGFVQISRLSFFFHGWGINWDFRHTLTPEQRRFLQPYFENADEIESHTMLRWLQES